MKNVLAVCGKRRGKGGFFSLRIFPEMRIGMVNGWHQMRFAGVGEVGYSIWNSRQ